MASANAAALVVRISADLKALKGELGQAANEVEKRAAQMERRFERMNPRSGNLLKGFGFGVALGVAQQLASSVGDIAEKWRKANKEIAEFARTARTIGASTDQVQQYRFAGQTEGISGQDTDKSLKDFAKNIKEAREDENELGKLFEANNVKLNDRNGNARSFNDLMMEAARLVANAKDEFDKIKIAETMGFSEEWVRVLEKGPNALRQSAAEARAFGLIADKELIAKATEFEEFWKQSWSRWSIVAKSTALDVANFMRDALARVKVGVGAPVDDITALQRNLAQLRASQGTSYTIPGGYGRRERRIESDNSGEIARVEAEIEAAIRRRGAAVVREMAANPPIRPAGPNAGDPAVFGDLRATQKVYGKPTVIPPKAEKPAKASAASETDQRYEEVERYIKQLEKQGRILEAERDTLGKSRVERAKAIELARIGTVTDEEQKKKLEEQIEKHVRIREEIEKIKRSKKAIEEATEFAGNQIIDVFDRIAQGGAKAKDIAADLARTLLKASMQALLLGQGPLAGIFGTAPGSGAGGVGGIIGAIMGATGYTGKYATGGQIPSGKWGIAGEAGPEIVKGPAMVYPAALSARALNGGGNAFNVNVTVAGVTTPQAVQAQILAGVNQAVQIARSVVPGDFRETQRRR